MYKSLKERDRSILCGCPLTQERERKTIVGCAVWMENTRLHRCFHRIQRVSLVLFAYALILVDMSPVSLGCSTLHAMAMNAQSRKMRISGHITFLLCF